MLARPSVLGETGPKYENSNAEASEKGVILQAGAGASFFLAIFCSSCTRLCCWLRVEILYDFWHRSCLDQIYCALIVLRGHIAVAWWLPAEIALRRNSKLRSSNVDIFNIGLSNQSSCTHIKLGLTSLTNCIYLQIQLENQRTSICTGSTHLGYFWREKKSNKYMCKKKAC